MLIFPRNLSSYSVTTDTTQNTTVTTHGYHGYHKITTVTTTPQQLPCELRNVSHTTQETEHREHRKPPGASGSLEASSGKVWGSCKLKSLGKPWEPSEFQKKSKRLGNPGTECTDKDFWRSSMWRMQIGPIFKQPLSRIT